MPLLFERGAAHLKVKRTAQQIAAVTVRRGLLIDGYYPTAGNRARAVRTRAARSDEESCAAVGGTEDDEDGAGSCPTARRGPPAEGRNTGAQPEVESRVMHNEFTAIIEPDGEWFIAYSPEIPGANGQGRTADQARANLGEAISLILEDRREDALRGVPPEAIRGTVVVE